MAIKSRIAVELERLRKQHSGRLRPQWVVQAAEPKTSPLHSCFEWQDTEAAAKWRLHQARQLILRVTVTYEGKVGEPIRMRPLVSLMGDRLARGGGYRALVDVLADSEMRARFLEQALEELQRIEARYSELKELADVLGIILVVAKTMKIDVEEALVKKWITKEWLKK